MTRRWIVSALVPLVGMALLMSTDVATATEQAVKGHSKHDGGPVALAAVAATSPSDAWAVGEQDDGAYIQHWDGTSWTAVQTPGGRYLRGVAAASASDAWAVGCCSGRNGYRPLAMHWDGTSWSMVASPGLGRQTPCKFTAVTALPGGASWAAGTCWGGEGPGFIQRWDGTAWHIVLTTPYQWEITAISAASETDVWAVGDRYRHGAADLALTLHWNGTRWHRVRSPHPARYSTVDVAAAAPGDAWTVGNSWHKPAIAQHWDGAQWVPVEVRAHQGNSLLDAVSLDSSRAGWAAGSWSTEQRSAPLLERWDGSTWSTVTGPRHDASGRPIIGWTSLESTSPTDAWVVGATYDDSLAEHGVIGHWDGSEWTLSWSDPT